MCYHKASRFIGSLILYRQPNPGILAEIEGTFQQLERCSIISVHESSRSLSCQNHTCKLGPCLGEVLSQSIFGLSRFLTLQSKCTTCSYAQCYISKEDKILRNILMQPIEIPLWLSIQSMSISNNDVVIQELCYHNVDW